MSVFRLIRRQAFALAIILCAASAYLWPGLYIEWFGVKLAPFVGPSIQLIMFGMGTTLTAADFLCVAKTRGAWPWGAYCSSRSCRSRRWTWRRCWGPWACKVSRFARPKYSHFAHPATCGEPGIDRGKEIV